MAEKTTVAFRIDESVKEEWEDAAERPEYDSLSHLIRLSVQREITDTETAPRTAQADTGTAGDSEMLQSLNRLEKVTGEIQEEIEAFNREQESEEMYNLKQVLLEVLPTTPGSYSPGAPDDPEPSDVGEKPRNVAGRIGADTSDVSDALGDLASEIGMVRSLNGYYWKMEE
jgi:antitoxin component of RelBE/YafQ-DinJ toxin-antitoxin module